MRPLARAACAALVAVGLLGCQSTADVESPRLAEQLFGLPETDLLACAGVPERQMEVGGIGFFTYTSAYVYQTAPAYYPGYYRGFGYDPFWPSTSRLVTYQCEATAEVFQGSVRRVSFNTPTDSGGNWRQCQAIFRNCLTAQPGG